MATGGPPPRPVAQGMLQRGFSLLQSHVCRTIEEFRDRVIECVRRCPTLRRHRAWNSAAVACLHDIDYQRWRNVVGLVMRCGFLLVGLVLLTQGAIAEPTRDEVMSGAARCAGIADNRTWLDCFYGSAQPMRALLALPPAPAAQTRLVPPPGAIYATPDASRYAPPQKSSGFFADFLGSSKPVASNVPMESYKFARDGTFTVVLKNGQTYRQEESDLTLAKWNRPAGTYLVTIIAASDKFILRIKDERGATYHVRRL